MVSISNLDGYCETTVSLNIHAMNLRSSTETVGRSYWCGKAWHCCAIWVIGTFLTVDCFITATAIWCHSLQIITHTCIYNPYALYEVLDFESWVGKDTRGSCWSVQGTLLAFTRRDWGKPQRSNMTCTWNQVYSHCQLWNTFRIYIAVKSVIIGVAGEISDIIILSFF
jgi:hypothetical protein